jgi:hypothetical protein
MALTQTAGTPVTPTNDALVTEPTTNYGQTATNLTIGSNGSVTGGTLAGTTINNGLVSNITVANNATLSGGKLSGFNTNLGILRDVTVSQYAQVQGGNYTGTIVNDGILVNPILLPTSCSIINNGVLENPIILPGCNITGGKMIGTIVVLGGTYSHVEIPPSAQIITQAQNIPAKIFNRFNAQVLNALPPTVVSQITPEQFTQIPLEAVSGLTSENMGALSPQVIQSLDAKQIAALNPKEFQQMPEDGVAKLLVNFDAKMITPREAEKLLPPRWTIDAQGNLTAPPGTRVSVSSLDIPNLPPRLKLPNAPDLNSNFALTGGKNTEFLIAQMNQVGAKYGFVLTQQKSGVVHADVVEEQKSEYAFMIDLEHILIVDDEVLRGLQTNEQGQYIIVTEDGKAIPITPMTKDPEGLLSVLGKGSEVDIQKSGEVMLKFKPMTQSRNSISHRTRDGDFIYEVVIFDPFIEPSLTDICQLNEFGELVCDWANAGSDVQPGIHFFDGARAKQHAKLIYQDGTAQQVYPTVLLPETLVEEAKKIDGVEKIIFRMDGTFAVTYQGMKLLLVPDSDTQVQPIPAGKKFKPSLTLQPNSKLLYQVPYLDQLFSTSLTITEFPTP